MSVSNQSLDVGIANGLRARKSFSTYLDLLRFTAALLVVLEHSVILGILPRLGVLTALSHESVMVFFVLSGLVIAASSLSPDATASDYVAARAARIYCVVLPALVCCYGVAVLTGTTSSHVSVARIASSLFFLDGVWLNYVEVPFNGAYWSLCYEVWYYALWGALLFVRRPVLRLGVAAVLLVAMGPALATLAGIWLMGALIAVQGDRIMSALRRVPRWGTGSLFALSILGVLVLASTHLQEDVRQVIATKIPGWWRLRNSELVVTDYALAMLVALHLVSALYLFGHGRRFHDSSVGRAVRYCAGFTFTLYLFHYPLLLLLKAASGPAHATPAIGLASIAIVLAAVWAIAFGTERQLPRWRRMAQAVVALASHHATVFGSGPARGSLARPEVAPKADLLA